MFLKSIVDIIAQSNIAAEANPYQKPRIFKLYLNAKVYPSGIDTSQYAIKFATSTTPVYVASVKVVWVVCVVKVVLNIFAEKGYSLQKAVTLQGIDVLINNGRRFRYPRRTCKQRREGL